MARNHRVLPGFSLSLGYTVFYLSVLALIPLSACFAKAFTLTPSEFVRAAWTDRAIAAYKFSLLSALWASVASVVLGLLVAWVLVRYEFPLKRLVDSLVDLPLRCRRPWPAWCIRACMSRRAGWAGSWCRWASRPPIRRWPWCWC